MVCASTGYRVNRGKTEEKRGESGRLARNNECDRHMEVLQPGREGWLQVIWKNMKNMLKKPSNSKQEVGRACSLGSLCSS